MSSASSTYFSGHFLRSVQRFRYADFLIKSTPAITLAFIICVTFRGDI